ncbi:hypothetical protein AAG906_000054 [Vitis piasezkii]
MTKSHPNEIDKLLEAGFIRELPLSRIDQIVDSIAARDALSWIPSSDITDPHPGSSQGSHGNTSPQEQEGVTTPHRQARRARAFYSPLH